MNELSMIGRIQEFDRRHGGKENSVLFQAMIYYQDGAVRDGTMPEGILAEPPQRDFPRLFNVLCFYRGRLAQAVSQFDSLKEHLTMSPQPERLEDLRKLQHVVACCKKDCQDAEAALSKTPEAQEREAQRQYQAEQQARAQAWANQLKDIRI